MAYVSEVSFQRLWLWKPLKVHKNLVYHLLDRKLLKTTILKSTGNSHRKNVQPRRSRNFAVLAITTAKIRCTVRFNTAPSKHRIETPFDGPRRRIPSSCPSNAVYVRLSARTEPLFRPSILSTPSTAPSLNYVFVTGTEYVEVTVIIIGANYCIARLMRIRIHSRLRSHF